MGEKEEREGEREEERGRGEEDSTPNSKAHRYEIETLTSVGHPRVQLTVVVTTIPAVLTMVRSILLLCVLQKVSCHLHIITSSSQSMVISGVSQATKRTLLCMNIEQPRESSVSHPVITVQLNKPIKF